MLVDNDFHLSLSVKLSLKNREQINEKDIALAIFLAQDKHRI
jgi:hypothetical protein